MQLSNSNDVKVATDRRLVCLACQHNYRPSLRPWTQDTAAAAAAAEVGSRVIAGRRSPTHAAQGPGGGRRQHPMHPDRVQVPAPVSRPRSGRQLGPRTLGPRRTLACRLGTPAARPPARWFNRQSRVSVVWRRRRWQPITGGDYRTRSDSSLHAHRRDPYLEKTTPIARSQLQHRRKP